MTSRTAVLVGNPKPASRTLAAALHVARELTAREPDVVVDLATLGTAVLDWADDEVQALVAQVAEADLVVVASPTFKATYSGLLKVFLDRFAADSLSGIAVPLMLGGGPAHTLAPDASLAPLLSHLGATTTPGLYVLDRQHEDPAAYVDWLRRVRPLVQSVLDHSDRPLGATA